MDTDFSRSEVFRATGWKWPRRPAILPAMQRREFLKTSLAASSLALMSQSASAAQSASAPREFYELRRYHLRRGPMQQRFDDFYRDAALPAWNRAGVKPVGVFDVQIGPDVPSKYVLLPFASADAMLAAREKFESDSAVKSSPFSTVAPNDPSYIRKESELLRAFSGIPKLEVPTLTAAGKPRLFELRTYEAHSRKANLKKIEMFNEGEIDIFRRTGLAPVFFGETLIGPKLPNLTYMLVFDDMAARDRNWDVFRNHPDWKKLSSTPGYTDPEILTNITSVFLRPTAYSQI